MAGSQPDLTVLGVPASAATASIVPAQPDPTAKYTVPSGVTETSSAATPLATSVSRTAPVPGSSRTSAPALVTATIPGSPLPCEAADPEGAPPPAGPPAPEDPEPPDAGPVPVEEDADEPPEAVHADTDAVATMASTTRPAASRALLGTARDRDEERELMARHDKAPEPAAASLPSNRTFSDRTSRSPQGRRPGRRPARYRNLTSARGREKAV